VSPEKNSQLLVNTPLTLHLEFEQVGPTIEVNLFATPLPALNAVDANMGDTIQNFQIIALPLEARNVAGLRSLQPGVVHTGIDDKVSPNTGRRAVAGARAKKRNVFLQACHFKGRLSRTVRKLIWPTML